MEETIKRWLIAAIFATFASNAVLQFQVSDLRKAVLIIKDNEIALAKRGVWITETSLRMKQNEKWVKETERRLSKVEALLQL